ncbi:MAG: polysaccharide biosynthesis tyrosine autokinase [Terracidiphilus sp.]|nr:polysaccharide biosynthesis tyrosine autokinase [Terracidiphilus sp.]
MTTTTRELTLRDMLRVLQRRRRVIIGTVAVCVAAAIVVCALTTRRYEALSTIELQRSANDSLGLDSMVGNQGGASDSLSANVDLQTQSSIQQSDQIALSVIKDLHLDKDKDFQPHFSLVGSMLKIFSPKGQADLPNKPLEDSPRLRQRVLGVFRANLKVKSIPGTRLLQVSYRNPDPKVASVVANDAVRRLIDFSFQVRFSATNDASKWLEVQLDDLRTQTTDLQAKLVGVQKDTGLFGAGSVDSQGKSMVYSPVLDRLQRATTALSDAQSNRILKGAIYETTKTGDAELISQLSGTSVSSTGGSGSLNSLTLIQSLRTQESTIQAQIEQDASKYGAAYPKLIEERAALSRVQQSLREEIGRIKGRARNDYEIASKAEAGARATYSTVKQEADRLNDKTIEFTILQRETTQSQDLYQDLLRRLKEAGVVEGLHSSNLTVVDVARVPSSPVTPNVPLYLSLGIGLGAFLGISGAFLVDAVDNRIMGSDDIEAMGMTLLGILPKVSLEEMKSSKPMLDAPRSMFSEAMRATRSALILSKGGLPPKILLVSSSSPGEGKSSVALNLAIALAQQEKKVLLVEADMRRPVLMQRLNLKPPVGLSQILSGQAKKIQAILLPGSTGVWILPGGPVPPYPAEILGSPAFESFIEEIKGDYNFIVFDTPPALPVTDVQLIARFADAMIIVARSGLTARVSLQRTHNLLVPHAKNPAAPAIGVVLNAVPHASSAYYEYYGYKQYGYYHEEKSDDEV